MLKSGPALLSTADSFRRLSSPVVGLDPPAFRVLLVTSLDDGGPSAGASLPLQSLYANDAVKHPLIHLPPCAKPLDPEPDFDDSDSDSDSDGSWEDRMDPITFARYYAATSPALAEYVREYDQTMSECLNQRVAMWIDGVL